MLNWFRRAQAQPEDTRSTLASPDSWFSEIFGALPAASGVTLGGAAALRVPAVRAAVMAIAETVATVPVKLFSREGDARNVASDHPAHTIVHSAWSPWCAAYEGKLDLTLSALLHGRGFARVIRVRGRVRELHPLPFESVRVDRDKATGEPIYMIRNPAGGEDRLGYRDVLDVRASGGISPVADLREAIGLAAVMEQHAARLFANGGRPNGVLKKAGRLSPDAVQRIAQSWAAANSGANQGKVAVLEEDTDFKPISMTSVDSQLLEARRFQVQEIARGLRVPLPIVGDIERATNLNSEQLGQQFLTFGLLPWFESWSAALTRTLLTTEERATLYFEPIVDDLLRADIAKRFEAYAKGIGPNGAFLTPNDVRARENMPPLPNGGALSPAAPAQGPKP
jgi:HK97 family phage portal protein